MSGALPQQIGECPILILLACTLVLLVACVLLARRRVARAAPAAATAAVADLDAARLERERIYSDLHDDIGAKLLTMIYTAPNPEHADRARAVLQDLRDIVSRTRSGVAGSLLEVLAQIRDETEQRLALMRCELAWEQEEGLADPALAESQALHLFRIMREAVSNALRHGHATRLRVRLRHTGSQLLLEVADDGSGGLPDAEAPGRGVASMKSRAAELRGSIQWDPATMGGTKVVLRFPLPAGA